MMMHNNKQLFYPLFWLSLWLLSLLVFSADASTKNTKDKNSWQFDVFLDDSKIGYHHFSRETINGVEQIISEAEFNVRFMFFTLYEYQHINQEKWRNGCLVKMQSKTDDNGDKQFVSVTRNSNQVQIKTGKTQLTTSDCIRSFAYWDLAHLNTSPLLNSQTGELMEVSLRKLGTETRDRYQFPVEAIRYQLVGKDIAIDLWYTLDDQWLALQSTTENGSLIHYQLKSAASQDTVDLSAQQNSEQKQ